MSEYQIDTTVLVDLKTDPGILAGPISEGMFGAIGSNVLSHSEFAEDHEALGLTGLRFPGGSLAENDRMADGAWIYDPALYETGFHPGYDLSDRASLDEMLALAEAEEQVLSLTVPVERFFDDPEAARPWMEALLARLDGNEVTLDIGNEAYSDPGAYGAVAAVMLDVLREARADGLEGITAGIQVMQDKWGSLDNNEALVAALEAADPALFAEIDAVRIHALDLPMRNSTRFEDVRARLFSPLMDAIEAAGGEAEVHVSAWAVRASETLPEGWTGPTSALLASSGAMLSLFSSLIELGAVRADAWGLAVSEWNRTALSFDGEDGARAFSPHAVTLGLMAESVVGLSLVDDGRLDAGISGGPIVQTYVGEDRAVIFLSAGDIDGTEDITLDLSGLSGDIISAHADRVALIDPAATHGGAAHAVREAVEWLADGTVRWTFEEDWETVRIELEIGSATATPEMDAITLGSGDWIRLSDLVDLPEGETRALWELRDAEGPGNWMVGGEIVDAAAGYRTDAFEAIWIRADAAASQQVLEVRAHDGTGWGLWEDLDLTTVEAPELTIDSVWAGVGTWIDLADVLTASGPVDRFELRDAEGGDNWWADGVLVGAKRGYVTKGSDGIRIWADDRPSEQTLYIRAEVDGVWGEWEAFTLDTGFAQAICLDGAPSKTWSADVALAAPDIACDVWDDGARDVGPLIQIGEPTSADPRWSDAREVLGWAPREEIYDLF